jgi:rubrerythrin
LWGREEVQHGRALGRWAEMADPSFNFPSAFERFHAGYKPPHFASDDALSVRGSRRGEMVARCVVESGTSSFYSAIRDATDEPVLKEIAGRIAADEFRHYKLFFETLHAQDEPDLPFWRKLKGRGHARERIRRRRIVLRVLRRQRSRLAGSGRIPISARNIPAPTMPKR